MSVWKVKIQCLPSWDTSADIPSMIKLPSWVPRSNWLCICAFFSNKNKNLEGMSPWFVECSLFCVCVCVCVLVAQLCLPLCDPMDYSLPGSSVHGILQVWILEWVAILFSRDLPGLGIESGSPGLQAESLLPEPPGMPSLFWQRIKLLKTLSLQSSSSELSAMLSSKL